MAGLFGNQILTDPPYYQKFKGFTAVDTDTTIMWNYSNAPGSFCDPLKAMTLYSPSFTIPKLNRFDGIVRGAPQASAGYFVDGISLIPFSEISDLFSLSEQSIIPRYLTTIIGTRQIFPVSPFFFDGYRSWFSEQKGMHITTDGSYAPVEDGFFCGPLISFDDSKISNGENHIGVNISNFESTINGTLSAGKDFQLFCIPHNIDQRTIAAGIVIKY